MLDILLSAGAAVAAEAAEGAAVDTVKAELAKISPTAQLVKALSEHENDVLWRLHEVVIAVARVMFGERLDADRALQLLADAAQDPRIRHRLGALWRESTCSSDERIAMLATAYFVGGQEASLRERLDWAVRGLFPVDAGVLGTVLECHDRLAPGQGLMALELSGGSGNRWPLVPTNDGIPVRLEGPLVSAQSLRALSAAHCLFVSEPADDRGTVIVAGPSIPAEVERAHEVRVLPLGRELARILGTIDWQEIARRRRANDAAARG